MKPFNLVLFTFLFLFLSCSPDKETIMPEVKDITESVYASGTVKSDQQYEVFSKVNATILKIYAEEGDTVKKGDPLIQFDDRNWKIVTENARIASSAADFDVNRDQLREAENNIALARNKYVNDSLFYYRQTNLWKDSIGSQAELDQWKLAFESSKLSYTNAELRYDQIRRQVLLASEQTKNNLQMAQLQEEDLLLRSEIDGIVYQINKTAGERVNSLNPIAELGTDNFYLELDIDEFDITKIEKGQKVIIRMDSHESQIYEGRIVSIEPIMNSRTRSFTGKAEFISQPTMLYPNLTAEANILIQEKLDALTIPRTYLLNDSTVVLEGGTHQTVQTGVMDYNLVEILNGITADTILELPEK